MGSLRASAGTPRDPKKCQKNFFRIFHFFYRNMKRDVRIHTKTLFEARFVTFSIIFVRFGGHGPSSKYLKMWINVRKNGKTSLKKCFCVNWNIPLHVPIEKNKKFEKKFFAIFWVLGGCLPESVGDLFFRVWDGNSKIATVTPILCHWCTPSKKISPIDPTV